MTVCELIAALECYDTDTQVALYAPHLATGPHLVDAVHIGWLDQAGEVQARHPRCGPVLRVLCLGVELYPTNSDHVNLANLTPGRWQL